MSTRTALWPLAILLFLASLGWDSRLTNLPAATPFAELVRVETTDGVRLEGAYRAGVPGSDVGLLLVHGFAGSFRSPLVADLGGALAQRGFSSLALNMRDHGCCTYTTLFEDSATDIGAGVVFLKQRGATRVILVGHSLGVNRITHYQAQLGDPTVRALVLLAGVGNAHQIAVLAGGRTTIEVLDEAARRIAENDRPNELMAVPFGPLGPPGNYLFTAPSLISNGGPNTKSDYFKWAPEIELPLLMVQASDDVYAVVQRPSLAKRAAVRAPRVDLVQVAGADHEFSQHGAALADIVAGWIGEAL